MSVATRTIPIPDDMVATLHRSPQESTPVIRPAAAPGLGLRRAFCRLKTTCEPWATQTTPPLRIAKLAYAHVREKSEGAGARRPGWGWL